ncbi:hypothetical protein PoB_000172400 [Plakobranchus ocellatus]|uniref:BCL-11A-like CCHC zinc finger domain-containing protein n=1 Tax=Plakobranchus ocellatus TaxID=259542 RepID=A0AAV3XZS1_9GAST|nr:hypothetical protein PoB_000172400 [Plakobranchus ocellatus]
MEISSNDQLQMRCAYGDSLKQSASDGHRSSHLSNPDYLTCGDCAREFLLDNITLFITHKARGCPRKARPERVEPPDDGGEGET